MENIRLRCEKQWIKAKAMLLKYKLSVNKYLENEGLKMSAKEFFSLLWINLKLRISNTLEFIKVAFKYYSNLEFLKADLSLRLMYLFNNPYKISKRFLMARGEADIYAYGETPLTTIEHIAKECNINKNDTVFELGAGRGRVCFWLNTFLEIPVVGIEHVPEFVAIANRIVQKLKLKSIEFRSQDFLTADLKGATVCYLYGTCLDDHLIEGLAQNFAKLPRGTKIITVSYPLSEYTKDEKFVVLKCFRVKYPWGNADVFLQVVR